MDTSAGGDFVLLLVTAVKIDAVQPNGINENHLRIQWFW